MVPFNKSKENAETAIKLGATYTNTSISSASSLTCVLMAMQIEPSGAIVTVQCVIVHTRTHQYTHQHTPPHTTTTHHTETNVGIRMICVQMSNSVHCYTAYQTPPPPLVHCLSNTTATTVTLLIKHHHHHCYTAYQTPPPPLLHCISNTTATTVKLNGHALRAPHRCQCSSPSSARCSVLENAADKQQPQGSKNQCR